MGIDIDKLISEINCFYQLEKAYELFERVGESFEELLIKEDLDSSHSINTISDSIN